MPTKKQQLEKAVKQIAKKIGMKDLDYTIRMDGRVELVCECGVGHPSRRLTVLYRGHWNEHDSVHGCCGHCRQLFPDPEKY